MAIHQRLAHLLVSRIVQVAATVQRDRALRFRAGLHRALQGRAQAGGAALPALSGVLPVSVTMGFFRYHVGRRPKASAPICDNNYKPWVTQ